MILSNVKWSNKVLTTNLDIKLNSYCQSNIQVQGCRPISSYRNLYEVIKDIPISIKKGKFNLRATPEFQ